MKKLVLILSVLLLIGCTGRPPADFYPKGPLICTTPGAQGGVSHSVIERTPL